MDYILKLRAKINPLYLSYFSTAMNGHHDQGNSYNKAFTWRLDYSFRGRVYDCCNREHGSRQGRHGAGVVARSIYLIHKQETNR